jgi:hypothetical protein
MIKAGLKCRGRGIALGPQLVRDFNLKMPYFRPEERDKQLKFRLGGSFTLSAGKAQGNTGARRTSRH